MTDQTTVSPPGTVAIEPPSTVLNPQTVETVSGGGKPSISEAAGDSLEDVLSGELARLRAEDAKGEPEVKDEKPEAEEKPDDKPKDDDKSKEKPEDKKDDKPAKPRSEDGKFAKAEKPEVAKEAAGDKGEPDKAATGQDGSERRSSEGRQHIEPPARFLPKEREAWGNVPNVVKSAIARFTSEHETEVQQYRTSHEEWTKLDKFHQMAKQHNTNIGEALERYTKLDGMLASNPIEGIRQILATQGITPEAYANHVLKNPDAHRAPAPQPQPDPMVRQMGSQVEQLKAEIETMRMEQAAKSIIEPFRADPAHPRYDELQDDIAFFLQSGKIPASLTPQEKLEAAYDMAVRINPTSEVQASRVQEAPAAKEEPSPAKLAAGKKSIRGAPDNGADTEVEDADQDISDLLRKEMRRMTRSA